MKRIITIACMLLTTGTFAQEILVPTSIIVTEAKYALDGTDHNGFDVVLQGSEKEVNNAWSKFLETKYGFKVKSKNGKTSGEELMNNSWSNQSFGLESEAVKDASGTHIRLWVFLGVDTLVNAKEYPAESANMKVVLKEFAKTYYIGVFNEELADQSKEVKSQGKEVSGLAEDKAKTEKAIAKEEAAINKAEKQKMKYQEQIQKYQTKLVSLDGDIQNSRQKIVEKRSKIDKTSNKLGEASDKFEDVEAAQKRIKEKIAAVEKL
ncbi:MAG: hypothetical protein WC044_06325 [Crocinitomicaceae bacterium]